MCFIAIIPHEILFDYYGEQMKLYLGKDAGDLLTSTLNKYVSSIVIARGLTDMWNSVVEATLAIILFQRCR